MYKILWTGLKWEVNTKILDKCIDIINLVSQNKMNNSTVRKHGVDCWASLCVTIGGFFKVAVLAFALYMIDEGFHSSI